MSRRILVTRARFGNRRGPMEPARPLSPLLRWIPVLRLPVAQAMAWMAAAGFVFALLNTALRVITLEMGPLEVQFLRYLCGTLQMVISRHASFPKEL